MLSEVVDLKDAGKLVRKLRRFKKLTQAELAAKLGTTQSAISEIESSRNRFGPSLLTLTKIADVLNLKMTICIHVPGERPKEIVIGDGVIKA